MTRPVPRPRTTQRLIIDNSVWQRLRQSPVREAMDAMMATRSPWSILTCPPVVAEVGFSARSGRDHRALREYLSAFPECENHPEASLVLDIQGAIWSAGLVRAVGAVDTVIVAYALVNDATVVHYDADFEHVARVWNGFHHRWIAPRGTLDR